MFKLSELQDHFQDYLIESDHVTQPKISDQVNGYLEVYYDAYRTRLIEGLAIDYPKCETLIHHVYNHNTFEAVALNYLQNYPSRHFSVRYFGKSFSYFLANTVPYNEHLYLSELADFEWSLLHTLDSADAQPLTIDALKNIPPQEWAELVFKLHPSVQCKTYEWAIPPLWKSIEASAPPVLIKQPTVCLFWRKNITSLFEVLPLSHQTFYEGIVAEKSFGDLCEDLFEITPEDQHANVPAIAIGILQYWIEQQVIVALV